MLLKKADTLPELSIKSLVEWRVWLELKRIKQELKTWVGSGQLSTATVVERFQGGKIKVKVAEDDICLQVGSRSKTITIDQFLKQPRRLTASIFNLKNNDK